MRTGIRLVGVRGSVATTTVVGAAVLRAGRAFVDFTPSTGARLPALDELAREKGVPSAGGDGKTGETLVKSVLAPMSARRALRVRSHPGGVTGRVPEPGFFKDPVGSTGHDLAARYADLAGRARSVLTGNGSSAHAHSIRGR
ncbi:hypothetical protein J2S54_001336 [Streptomyces sp. DSM 42143]|nr:hypothetical protein [Streptomyces sp. DSM 42143]